MPRVVFQNLFKKSLAKIYISTGTCPRIVMPKKLRILYLWFKSLFKKRMTTEEVYRELLLLRNDVFRSLEEYLKAKSADGYVKVLSVDTENHILEFKVGELRFLLQAAIHPYKRNVMYKTFLRTLNLDFYPALSYTQNEVNDLELETGINGLHKFLTPKQAKGDFTGYDREVDLDYMRSPEFGKSYMEQVEKWLKK